MSKGHTAVNEFLEKKVRYADFFNGNLFQGKQVVLPEELEIIKGESNILVEDKEENTKDVHRYRDIVMRWKKEIYLVVLACETQAEVHYAMPVRKMLYDSLSYVDQMKELWEIHERNPKREKLTRQEYLSHFRKEDKLIPVITVVFYYGRQGWDGSTDLYGMFANHAFLENENIQKYIPNYWINLIDADNVEDVDCFQTDLKEIFGMLKCRKDKHALVEYMHKNEAYFRHVDSETCRAIGELLQSKSILEKAVTKKEEESEMDMCKALEDLYQDGINEGTEIGKDEKLRELIKRKMEKGDSIEKIADDLVESIEVVQRFVKELQ